MSFLNPAILFALFLAGLPLLIHLLNQRRFKEVNFSTLRFLRIIEENTIRRLKVKNILLIILRTLFIVFLVLGLARPLLFTKGYDLLQGERNRPSFIILDNSASMGRIGESDTLLRRIKNRLINIFPEESFPARVVLLTSDGKLRLDGRTLVTHSRFQDVVNNIPQTWAGDNFSELFHRVKQMAIDFHSGSGLILIASDFQHFNRALMDTFRKVFPEERWRVLFLVPQDWPGSVTIASLDLADRIIQVNKPFQLNVLLQNNSSEQQKVQLRLYLDGKVSGQMMKQLAPVSITREGFNLLPTHPGDIRGWFQVEESNRRESPFQRYYFVLRVPDRIRVLVIAQDEEFSILKLLFDTYPGELIESHVVTPEQVQFEQLERYQIFLMVNQPPENRILQKVIDLALTRGRGIFYITGDKVDSTYYQQILVRKYGFPTWKKLLTSDGNNFLLWEYLDGEHPLFRGLWVRLERNFDSPEFYTMIHFDNSGYRIPSSLTDGIPLILEANDKNLLLLASNIVKWSDLATRGIFSPLILRSIQYLASRELFNNERLSYEIGAELSFLTSWQYYPQIRVKSSAGKEILLSGGNLLKNEVQRYLTEPGIYQFQTDSLEYYLALNISESERRFEKVNLDSLVKGYDNVYLLDEEMGSEIEAKYVREYWRFFYLLAFVTIFIELWLTRGSRGKQTETAE